MYDGSRSSIIFFMWVSDHYQQKFIQFISSLYILLPPVSNISVSIRNYIVV
jgi:hypothetical protein